VASRVQVSGVAVLFSCLPVFGPGNAGKLETCSTLNQEKLMLSYNPSFVPPTRVEAIDLLQACWPLLERILNLGAEKLELSDNDLLLLMGFQKVVLAELTSDQEILNNSGITSSDIVELDHLLACYRYDSIPILDRIEKNSQLAQTKGKSRIKSKR
jgi:hypothetical protein